MAINQIENHSCSLQVIREPNISGSNFVSYGDLKLNPLVDFAMKAMDIMSIPLISVDLAPLSRDQFHEIVNTRPALKLTYL